MEQLISKYRMMGFDKPDIINNKYFRSYTLNITDACGQWRLIKGKTERDCLLGAMGWAKKNWNKVQRERLKLMRSYPLSNTNRKRRAN